MKYQQSRINFKFYLQTSPFHAQDTTVDKKSYFVAAAQVAVGILAKHRLLKLSLNFKIKRQSFKMKFFQFSPDKKLYSKDINYFY